LALLRVVLSKLRKITEAILINKRTGHSKNRIQKYNKYGAENLPETFE